MSWKCPYCGNSTSSNGGEALSHLIYLRFPFNYLIPIPIGICRYYVLNPSKYWKLKNKEEKQEDRWFKLISGIGKKEANR